jgi:SAM-dependent methyltransferase
MVSKEVPQDESRATTALPLWIRGLLLASRGMTWIFRAQEVLRDEILTAFVAPELRDAVTTAAYSRYDTYLPGGAAFEQGLLSWEIALLERPELPRRGRVLLAGAGGGREVKALADRGYEVSAFEPVERYCSACAKALDHRNNVQVVCGSYKDLVKFARTGAGRFAAFRSPFDLVWLGWASFAHITDVEDQVAVLRSLGRVAPNAPVVLSFFLNASPERPGAPTGLRRILRRILVMLGGRHASPAIQFWPWAGFAYAFTRSELQQLFRAAGYSPAVLQEDPYPHALLVADHSASID